MAAKSKIIDFTGVKDNAGNFRPKRKPEGDYYAHIVAVADHTSKDDNEGWVFTIRVDGDGRSSYPYYVMFDEKQAWKPRNLCIAAGLPVPTKRVKLNPNQLVGKALGIALADDEYEGRVKSTIDAVFPLDDISDPRNEPSGKASSTKAKSRQAEDDDDDDDEDEEDEPVAPTKTKASKKKVVEPDDDEEEDDEEDDEPPAKKVKATRVKGKSKKQPEPESDDDEDDDDDDDEPVAPAKKVKSSAKKSKKSRDDDDDEDELDLDDL